MSSIWKCRLCGLISSGDWAWNRHIVSHLLGRIKRCIVHDQSYTRVCTGCAADRKAGEVA